MFPDPVVLPDFWTAFSHAHSRDVVAGYWRVASSPLHRAPDYIGAFFSSNDARVEIYSEGACIFESDIPAGDVIKTRLVLLAHPGALEVRATCAVYALCCVLPRSSRSEVLLRSLESRRQRRKDDLGGVPSLPFTELLGKWENMAAA